MKVEHGFLVVEDEDKETEVRVFCGVCKSQIKDLEFDGDITVICEQCVSDLETSKNDILDLEDEIKELRTKIELM